MTALDRIQEAEALIAMLSNDMDQHDFTRGYLPHWRPRLRAFLEGRPATYDPKDAPPLAPQSSNEQMHQHMVTVLWRSLNRLHLAVKECAGIGFQASSPTTNQGHFEIWRDLNDAQKDAALKLKEFERGLPVETSAKPPCPSCGAKPDVNGEREHEANCREFERLFAAAHGTLYTTREYPCGCRAAGSGDVPSYCSTHECKATAEVKGPTDYHSVGPSKVGSTAVAEHGEANARLLHQMRDVEHLAGEIIRLTDALRDVASMKVVTDCGIHPMRAAGLRQGFELAAEIANKAIVGDSCSHRPAVKSNSKPSASTDDTPPAPTSSVECPKCRTQLAFDGDACGLCQEEA